MAAQWDKHAKDGFRFFEQGQQELLKVDRTSAQNSFSTSATHFLSASSLSVENREEMKLNAAISLYHAGQWQKCYDIIMSIERSQLPTDALKQTLLEIENHASRRCDQSVWDSFYRDYRYLMEKKEYDAALDLLRNDPYILDEPSYRQVIVHLLTEKGLKEIVDNIKSNWEKTEESNKAKSKKFSWTNKPPKIQYS